MSELAGRSSASLPLAGVIPPQPAVQSDSGCNCKHLARHHQDEGLGPCTQLDSYEQPCACPSFDEMDDGDEDSW